MKGKERTYHINLLKPFHERTNPLHLLSLAIAEEVEAKLHLAQEYYPPIGETVNDVTFSATLAPQEQKDMYDLLDNYPDTQIDKPGSTNLVQVNLNIIDNTPIRSKPYPVPLAKEETIQNEIK